MLGVADLVALGHVLFHGSVVRRRWTILRLEWMLALKGKYLIDLVADLLQLVFGQHAFNHYVAAVLQVLHSGFRFEVGCLKPFHGRFSSEPCALGPVPP